MFKHICEWRGPLPAGIHLPAKRQPTAPFLRALESNRLLMKQLCLGVTTYDARFLKSKTESKIYYYDKD